MGNKSKGASSPSLSSAYNPSLNNWHMVSRGNEFSVWSNSLTRQEIQEYKFMVNDDIEFEQQKTVFEARFDNDNLVASKYFVDNSENEFCSKYYKGSLFTERIPLRLFQFSDIQFPDILHVYSQCLKGFAELYDTVGYFVITEQMVGINTEGVVKVWLNRNFGRLQPEPVYVSGTQRQMVLRCIKVVNNSTSKHLPFSIADVLVRNDPYTFRDAFCSLESLTVKFNVDIPDCIEAAAVKLRQMSEKCDSIVSHVDEFSPFSYAPKISLVKPQGFPFTITQQSQLARRLPIALNDKQEVIAQKKMPIKYSAVGFSPHFKQSNSSMASAFPDLSRISRISLGRQNEPLRVPSHAWSPAGRPTTKFFPIEPEKPKASVRFDIPQPRPQKNTDLSYSTSNRLPATSVKHLPIIRQNNKSQTSLNQSVPSFNIHLSDRHQLVQRYLRTVKPEASRLVASPNPPNYSVASYNKLISKESSISRLSAIQPIYGQETVNGLSLLKQNLLSEAPMISHHSIYQFSQVSAINPKHPVISRSSKGVVYKQSDEEPAFLSEASSMTIQHSLMNPNSPVVNSKPTTKISMMSGGSFYLNNSREDASRSYSHLSQDPDLFMKRAKKICA